MVLVLGGGAPGGLATKDHCSLGGVHCILRGPRASTVVLLSGPGAPAIPHSPYHLIVTTESDAGYVFTTLR